VKIRTEKKSLEKRAILGKNLKEPPLYNLLEASSELLGLAMGEKRECLLLNLLRLDLVCRRKNNVNKSENNSRLS
jgi:hypothetical protein